MRRFAWMGIVALVGLASVSCNDALEDKEVFIANLSGGRRCPPEPPLPTVPPRSSSRGTRSRYAIEVDDITSIIQAHIHTAAPGVNGPVRLFLYPAPPAVLPAPLVTVTDKTILVEATVASSFVNGVTYEELLAAMRSGNAYVNVHTTQFPGGEMRGIIRPQNVD